MALGAAPERSCAWWSSGVLAQVLLGIAIGVALASSPFARPRQPAVPGGPHRPGTFATVPLLLVGAAVLAALGPALRATRVDPARALRCE